MLLLKEKRLPNRNMTVKLHYGLNFRGIPEYEITLFQSIDGLNNVYPWEIHADNTRTVMRTSTKSYSDALKEFEDFYNY